MLWNTELQDVGTPYILCATARASKYQMEPDSRSAQVDDPQVTHFRILLVEDSSTDAHVIRLHLEHGLELPFSIESTTTIVAVVAAVARERFDLVLLDMTLPNSNGLETFQGVYRQAQGDAILMLSSEKDIELAVKAVRNGAQDYILKGELSPQALGREVRFALERNRRMHAAKQLHSAREQIHIACRLQKQLYPDAAPQLAGLDIAGCAWAAEHTCGDYFDFIRMKDGALGIVVGDVSGHGLGPALKMVEARAALHSLAQYEDDLNRLIAGLHRVFCNDRHLVTRDLLFLSLFIGRVDAAARTMQYASAGHPGFLLSTAGNVSRLATTGFPVGMVDGMPHQEGARLLALQTGDTIVVPTDGFFEAGSLQKNMFGVDRMMEVVHQHRHRTAREFCR